MIPNSPISLLNIFGKIFARILTNRLREFLVNNFLSDYKFGFRPERTTNDPIVLPHTDVTIALDFKRCVTVFDIKGSFYNLQGVTRETSLCTSICRSPA